VPPLGTQGQAWLVVFSQGLLGAVLFYGFFLRRLMAHALSRRTTVVFALPVVVFFLIETLIYDTLGSPLFTVMIAVGLMWRADYASSPPRTGGGRLRTPTRNEVTT
jgi:predicted membrane-bound dolichyl-phosphate-mannose-protein mannosyltransferase